jgi:hypothetical protein
LRSKLQKEQDSLMFQNNADLKVSFPDWPSDGITSLNDLGKYISDAAYHFGWYNNRRALAEELTTVLLQSTHIVFAHSVFVPSEELKTEFSSRVGEFASIFNKYSVVSRVAVVPAGKNNTTTTTSSKVVTSPLLLPKNNKNSKTGNNEVVSFSDSTEPTLVFAKKAYFKWLEDVVAKKFPDTCPVGDDAESLYQSSLGFAPERDIVILELLVCATASFVFPDPFSTLEEKVKKFNSVILSSS